MNLKQFSDSTQNQTLLWVMIKPFSNIVIDIIRIVRYIGSWKKKHDWPMLLRDSVHAVCILIAVIAGFVVYGLVVSFRQWFMDFFKPFGLGEQFTFIVGWFFAAQACGYIAGFVIEASFKLIFQVAFGDSQYFLTEYQTRQLQNSLISRFNLSLDDSCESVRHLQKYCREIISKVSDLNREEWIDAFEYFKEGNPMLFLHALKHHRDELTFITAQQWELMRGIIVTNNARSSIIATAGTAVQGACMVAVSTPRGGDVSLPVPISNISLPYPPPYTQLQLPALSLQPPYGRPVRSIAPISTAPEPQDKVARSLALAASAHTMPLQPRDVQHDATAYKVRSEYLKETLRLH